MEQKNSFAKGLIGGVIVGALAGLMFAPRPGKETRHFVRQKAGSYMGNMRQRVRRGRTQESSNGQVPATIQG